MKTTLKIIDTTLVLFIMLSQHIIYASMADFTDEQADKALKQEQEEWQHEQENRINKSSNNYLKELSINNQKIIPNFDKQTINYEIEKEVVDDYVEIKAEADDEKASVSGTGKILLSSGDNNLRIDVTAENGTVRTYYIKLKKSVKSNLRLSKLEIKNENNIIETNPEFDKEVFEYNCNVDYYVSDLDIETSTDNKDAKIEITGNKNLNTGLNEVLITVSNNNEKTVYKINVYKSKEKQVINDNININYIVLIAIVSIIIIIIIIFVIKKNKIKKNRKH